MCSTSILLQCCLLPSLPSFSPQDLLYMRVHYCMYIYTCIMYVIYMHAHICFCVCKILHAYLHAQLYMHTYMHCHICICACMLVHVYVHIQFYVLMHEQSFSVCMCMQSRTHVHRRPKICTPVHSNLCMFMCVHDCMYVCMCAII